MKKDLEKAFDRVLGVILDFGDGRDEDAIAMIKNEFGRMEKEAHDRLYHKRGQVDEADFYDKD